MTINIPYKIRAGLYVFTMIGSPIVAYLAAKTYIGDLEVGLWLAEVTVISALAAFNTKPNNEETI